MEERKNTKKIVQYAAIGVMLLLIIAAIVVMVVMNKNNQNNNEEPETTTHVDTYEDFVAKGDTYCNEGNYEMAIEEYQKALELNENAELMFKVANIYRSGEYNGKALSYLYEILDVTKEEKGVVGVRDRAYLNVIDIYILINDNDAAYRLMCIAEEEYAGIVATYLEKGKVTVPEVNPYAAETGYVYFGEYPQDKIDERDIPEYITTAKYDENGVACIYGRKYAKVGDSYFSYSPIKWEILVDQDSSYILMTDMLRMSLLIDYNRTIEICFLEIR